MVESVPTVQEHRHFPINHWRLQWAFASSKGFITELLLRRGMAHKKRKEPAVKEEYRFVPPDFNEKEFLEKDIAITKTVLLSALLAVVFGVIAYFTTDITFIIGLLLILVGAVALRKMIELFPLDLSAVENKTWLGNGLMFFFLALGVWILLLNPPFGDAIEPQIRDLEVWVGDVEYQRPYQNVPVGTVTFNVTVFDNGELSKVQFSFIGSEGSWDMVKGEDGRYEYTHTFEVPGTYTFEITAVDKAGNTNTYRSSIGIIEPG